MTRAAGGRRAGGDQLGPCHEVPPDIGNPTAARIKVARYEVVVEREEPTLLVYSIELPGDLPAYQVTVPPEFIALGEEFKYEILVRAGTATRPRWRAASRSNRGPIRPSSPGSVRRRGPAGGRGRPLRPTRHRGGVSPPRQSSLTEYSRRNIVHCFRDGGAPRATLGPGGAPAYSLPGAHSAEPLHVRERPCPP